MKVRHFGAINGFMGNIYINITCSSPFWIQWCQMCLDWTIPPEVRAVYIFWLGGWGYEPHASFVIWMSSQQTRIVLKTLTFKLQPMILNWYLRNTFRSDHLVKNVASLYISHRGGFGILAPTLIILIWMFFSGTQIVLKNLAFKVVLKFKLFASIWNDWSNILEQYPQLFMTPFVVLWETYTLI